MPSWKNELDHLKPHYQKLKNWIPELTEELDRLFNTSEEVALLTYARRTLEIIATKIYEENTKNVRGTKPLDNILNEFRNNKTVPEYIVTSMKNLNSLGNLGAHPKPFSDYQIKEALISLATVLEWCVQYSISNNTIVEDRVQEKPTEEYQKKSWSSLKKITMIGIFLTLIIAVIIHFPITSNNNLEELANTLVHDLEKDISTSHSIYIHPLNLSVSHEQKSHLDILDSVLHDALKKSKWLVPLDPKEKLSSADLLFLRQKTKCGDIKYAHLECSSLIDIFPK